MKLSAALVRPSLIGVGATCAIASALLITACGGGGGGGGTGSGSGTAATVASALAGTPKYSQKLLLTVSGSNLDQGLAVTATGCSGITLSTSAPSVSTATTAYYQCTVSGSGAGQFVVTRTSDNATLATTPFTVPVPQVTMTVSNGAGGGVSGTLVVTLAPNQTPLTVNNFLAYVNARFYDGTVFHRVSPGFVIQGGGYASPVDNNAVTPKPTNAPIALEVNKGLSNTKWTIAMARSCGSAPSTSSQFFINLADNSAALDPSPLPTLCFANPPLDTAGYAVFGNVVASSAMVASIASAPCQSFPDGSPLGTTNECMPSPNVVITSAVQTQ
ncbi:MAG: peptidylprolyl isomerase [Bacteriovorax sp.]|nr:peptidylprolyl isomerase [Rhizobacter sp.]